MLPPAELEYVEDTEELEDDTPVLDTDVVLP
jgi:hypothetical protein